MVDTAQEINMKLTLNEKIVGLMRDELRDTRALVVSNKDSQQHVNNKLFEVLARIESNMNLQVTTNLSEQENRVQPMTQDAVLVSSNIQQEYTYTPHLTVDRQAPISVPSLQHRISATPDISSNALGDVSTTPKPLYGILKPKLEQSENIDLQTDHSSQAQENLKAKDIDSCDLSSIDKRKQSQDDSINDTAPSKDNGGTISGQALGKTSLAPPSCPTVTETISPHVQHFLPSLPESLSFIGANNTGDTKRFPVICKICNVKLFAKIDFVLRHCNSKTKHPVRLLHFKDLEILEPQMNFEKGKFCSMFKIDETSCHIVTSENFQVLRSFVEDAAKGTYVNLAFDTVDSMLTQLTLFREQTYCIISPQLISQPSSSPVLSFLKDLFENNSITKIGEHSWLLMFIVLKTFDIRSKTFMSLPRIDRERKPITGGNYNPVTIMFETVSMLPTIFNSAFASTKPSRLPSITSGNLEAIKPLLNHLLEIDLDRKQLIDSDWELHVTAMGVDQHGKKIEVQPEPSHKRLRQKSHVLVTTQTKLLKGDVNKKPTSTTATINLKYDHLRCLSEVISMKVQRFNESNVTFRRRASFICRRLSTHTVN